MAGLSRCRLEGGLVVGDSYVQTDDRRQSTGVLVMTEIVSVSLCMHALLLE